jgi:aspartate/glutamate/glutamine transport system substrate-binding protein
MNHPVKATLFSLFAAAALLAAAWRPASADALLDIKTRGVLNVGVKADVLDFGFLNPKTNQYEGYEIDIAHELAKRLLGDANKIKFTTVTAKTRSALLDSGEIDMVIATFTITDKRKLVLDFSPPYFTDGIALLVQKSSGIKSLADLNNKTIGVAKGSDTATRLTDKAAEMGNVLLNFSAFETYGEILAAMQAGRVQAFSTDGSILKYYEQQDPSTVILPDRYSNEDYGVTTKKGNDSLRDWVAAQITQLRASGTLKRWQQHWGIYNENQFK